MIDPIERQDAIDALEREQSHVERPITETRWFDLGLRKAQEILSKLSSAQQKPLKYSGESICIFCRTGVCMSQWKRCNDETPNKESKGADHKAVSPGKDDIADR